MQDSGQSEGNEPEPHEDVDFLVDDVDWQHALRIVSGDRSGWTKLQSSFHYILMKSWSQKNIAVEYWSIILEYQ